MPKIYFDQVLIIELFHLITGYFTLSGLELDLLHLRRVESFIQSLHLSVTGCQPLVGIWQGLDFVKKSELRGYLGWRNLRWIFLGLGRFERGVQRRNEMRVLGDCVGHGDWS